MPSPKARKESSKSARPAVEVVDPVINSVVEDVDELEEFIVERIVSSKVEAGRELFYIKWLGYDDEEKDNTWEPLTNLDCDVLLAEFRSREEALTVESPPPSPKPEVTISPSSRRKRKAPSAAVPKKDVKKKKKKLIPHSSVEDEAALEDTEDVKMVLHVDQEKEKSVDSRAPTPSSTVLESINSDQVLPSIISDAPAVDSPLLCQPISASPRAPGLRRNQLSASSSTSLFGPGSPSPASPSASPLPPLTINSVASAAKSIPVIRETPPTPHSTMPVNDKSIIPAPAPSPSPSRSPHPDIAVVHQKLPSVDPASQFLTQAISQAEKSKPSVSSSFTRPRPNRPSASAFSDSLPPPIAKRTTPPPRLNTLSHSTSRPVAQPPSIALNGSAAPLSPISSHSARGIEPVIDFELDRQFRDLSSNSTRSEEAQRRPPSPPRPPPPQLTGTNFVPLAKNRYGKPKEEAVAPSNEKSTNQRSQTNGNGNGNGRSEHLPPGKGVYERPRLDRKGSSEGARSEIGKRKEVVEKGKGREITTSPDKQTLLAQGKAGWATAPPTGPRNPGRSVPAPSIPRKLDLPPPDAPRDFSSRQRRSPASTASTISPIPPLPLRQFSPPASDPRQRASSRSSSASSSSVPPSAQSYAPPPPPPNVHAEAREWSQPTAPAVRGYQQMSPPDHFPRQRSISAKSASSPFHLGVPGVQSVDTRGYVSSHLSPTTQLDPSVPPLKKVMSDHLDREVILTKCLAESSFYRNNLATFNRRALPVACAQALGLPDELVSRLRKKKVMLIRDDDMHDDGESAALSLLFLYHKVVGNAPLPEVESEFPSRSRSISVAHYVPPTAVVFVHNAVEPRAYANLIVGFNTRRPFVEFFVVSFYFVFLV